MSLLSKYLKNEKDKEILALDIGTEVVKALVCVNNAKEMRSEVLGVGKVRQRLGNMQSGAVSDIGGVIDTSREAIEMAKKKAKISKVDKAIVGIAGELVKGITTTVHYERVRPELKVEAAELKNIIQKVQEKAYERIRRQLEWETGQNDIQIKLINAVIVHVEIDGYRVTNPIGFQGRDVSISVFNAYAPMIHLGALESIANELNIDLVSIAAEPYAVARSVGIDSDTTDFNAIFIDVGGGTTDIAVVRNGGLEGTKMFALGGRVFTKRIAQVLGIDFEEAEKLKLKYSQGSLGMESSAKVNEILTEDCNIWLSGIELSLAEFAENDLLPSKILLCGGGSGLPGIKDSLSRSDWVVNLPFARPPEINFLQPRDVVRVIDKTGELKNPQDVTPMGLANLTLDLEGEEKILSSMLRRAMQTLEE